MGLVLKFVWLPVLVPQWYRQWYKHRKPWEIRIRKIIFSVEFLGSNASMQPEERKPDKSTIRPKFDGIRPFLGT